MHGTKGLLLHRVCNCSARLAFCACASRLAGSRCDVRDGSCASLPGYKAVIFKADPEWGERSVEDPRVTFEPGRNGSGVYWLVYSVYTKTHDRTRRDEAAAAAAAGSLSKSKRASLGRRPWISGDLGLASCMAPPRGDPRDPKCWVRHGVINPADLPHGKSGALFLRPGRAPLLYWGEGVIALAEGVTEPLDLAGSGRPNVAGPFRTREAAWLKPRPPPYFDSQLVEVRSASSRRFIH